jgi:hypothetical protein
MAPGASNTACSPGRGSGTLGRAKWARCWSAWSGAWRDTFAGADSSGPLTTGRGDGEGDPEGNLAASAVFGQAPPAGPQWVSRLAPLEPQALAYAKPLCASLDGFTLHAATRAGALDSGGREALLRYVLRPPVAQERVEQRPDGLVRITLKKAYNDGTIAVDMDPLSLLCRLATSVPPPRFHTVKYAGVLAPASRWRSRLAPASPAQAAAASDEQGRPDHAGATVPGRSSWRAPSRWTSSPVPAARGG